MPKKLNRLQVEETLKTKGMLIFSPQEFRDIFDVSKTATASFISSNLKSGLFLKLKANCYILKDSQPSLYFLANKLYQPSYISLETALSFYGIIPETVYALTSLTTKPTREFFTPKGVFSYQKVKKSVFSGYLPLKIENNLVYFALPEKALVDYLYFVDLKRVLLNERINLKKINKKELLKWCSLFERPLLFKLIKQIYANQRNLNKIN
ncbi:MAG: hypothetical protein Q8N55_00210 [bacterium]|nr:hypothetical protein [bacterium]